jgi:hypothetical protein
MKFNKEALSLALGLMFRANVASAVFIALIWFFKGWVFHLMLLNWLLWNSIGLIISVTALWKTRDKGAGME